MRLVRSILFAALLVACGSDEPGPPLETCFSGDYFAECGGDGASRFACRADGECKWFVGGVVADGFGASDCPADDACCHEEWPFVERDEDSSYFIWYQLYGFGRAAWDRDREMNLLVDVDDRPIGTSSLSCSGGQQTSGETPCSYPIIEAHQNMEDTLSFQVGRVGLYGWLLWIEVDPPRSRARACQYRYTDIVGGDCGNPDVVCATSGSISLTAIPEAWGDASTVGARVELRFADGLTISGAL